MASTPNPTAPVRRILQPDQLRRIHTAIRDAPDTRQLLASTLDALYGALTAGSTATTGPADPDRYAIPTSQWQAILAAMTARAQAWGTAAQVGLELALGLLPAPYDDPDVPAPRLELPDHRPAEIRITLTRDALDVIAATETHLSRLRGFYGPPSRVYQDALHSWHRNLTAILTMNTGSDIHISADAPLSLFIRTSSGLTYGLIFHPATRHCTSDGCPARIADDGTARPAHTDATVPDHQHTPSYPLDAPRPGTWSLHS